MQSAPTVGHPRPRLTLHLPTVTRRLLNAGLLSGFFVTKDAFEVGTGGGWFLEAAGPLTLCCGAGPHRGQVTRQKDHPASMCCSCSFRGG